MSLDIYIGRNAALDRQHTSMANPQLPTRYIEPAVIKPYAFPDPLVQARPPIPWIDPTLNPLPPDLPRCQLFSLDNLECLVSFVADAEPWAQPHGQRTKVWKVILDKLQSENRFKASSIATIQNKLNMLVAWQEVAPVPFEMSQPANAHR